MTKEVYVFPLTQGAIEWLINHSDNLNETFRKLHRGKRIGVSLDHPHGLTVMSATGSHLDEVLAGRWNPDEPPVYAYVPCHWNAEHLKTSEEDIRNVLRQLGAELSEFEVEASE